MIRFALPLATLFAGIAPAPPVAPAETPAEMTMIRGDAPLTIRADRAYILYRYRRIGLSMQPVLMRIPTAEEMAQYRAAKQQAFDKALPKLQRQYDEAVAGGGKVPPVPSIDTFSFNYAGLKNLDSLGGRVFAPSPDGDFYLAEVIPGDFVLYGMSSSGGLDLCNCLGTVGFTATAGQVVDIGTYLADRADRQSAVPELAAESGLGVSVNATQNLRVATLRPVAPGAALPPALGSATVVPADFRAIGPFVNAAAPQINRLAPIVGVLGYGPDGQVLDVKRNAEAPGLE
jgi:hypothetical protein